MYLGKDEIKSTSVPDPKGDVNVTFKERKEGLTVNNKLVEYAKTEEAIGGEAEDAIYYKIAEIFLFQLAEYGITVIEMPTIVSFLQNLVVNKHREVIAEKFGVNDPKMMKLSELFKR